jgi:hypothetical protein
VLTQVWDITSTYSHDSISTPPLISSSPVFEEDPLPWHLIIERPYSGNKSL